MNNKTPVRAATTCMLFLALSFQQEASGYEIRTHARMSREAALQAANLTGNLENLGLSSLFDEVSQGGSTKKALEWIEEGAEREDDTLSEVFARYRNHFYDPISGRGFGGILWRDSGFISGMPAPDWALDKGPADDQLFSFRQARQYLFDGLTQPTKADRERSLALMFRTLGNVVHVVQDMAQPQHTRNDGHGDGSLYELYTDEKRNSLSYSGAAIPSFSKARDLFANSSGTGLAQYSNANFVSAGTNFRYQNGQMLPSGNYAYPTPGPNIQSVSVQDLDVSPLIKTSCGQDPACNMRFVSGTNDRGETHGRTATLSIFYDDLEQYNVTLPDLDLSPYFSLNRFNFDRAHMELIPRAVGYSAGMIDYFFRGRMDFVPDSVNPGHYVIKNLGNEYLSGSFALFYDDANGVRHAVPDASWQLSIAGNGSSQSVTFADPSNPAPKTPGEYTLVFQGTLGAESGAVAGKLVLLGLPVYGLAPTFVGTFPGIAFREIIFAQQGSSHDPSCSDGYLVSNIYRHVRGSGNMEAVEGLLPGFLCISNTDSSFTMTFNNYVQSVDGDQINIVNGSRIHTYATGVWDDQTSVSQKGAGSFLSYDFSVGQVMPISAVLDPAQITFGMPLANQSMTIATREDHGFLSRDSLASRQFFASVQLAGGESEVIPFTKLREFLENKIVKLDEDTIKIALLGNDRIVATADLGTKTLTTERWTAGTTSLDVDGKLWSQGTSGLQTRTAVIYAEKTVGDLVNPLIAVVNLTAINMNFHWTNITITWNEGGILKFGKN